jgi:hypothetical protein
MRTRRRFKQKQPLKERLASGAGEVRAQAFGGRRLGGKLSESRLSVTPRIRRSAFQG